MQNLMNYAFKLRIQNYAFKFPSVSFVRSETRNLMSYFLNKSFEPRAEVKSINFQSVVQIFLSLSLSLSLTHTLTHTTHLYPVVNPIKHFKPVIYNSEGVQ